MFEALNGLVLAAKKPQSNTLLLPSMFPFWVFLVSVPVNVGFALVAALIGLRIGTRASQALIK